jgi:hypothetical protein
MERCDTLSGVFSRAFSANDPDNRTDENGGKQDIEKYLHGTLLTGFVGLPHTTS